MKRLTGLLLFLSTLAAHASPTQWSNSGCREIAKAIHPDNASEPDSVKEEDAFIRAWVLADLCQEADAKDISTVAECLIFAKAQYAKFCTQFPPIP